MKITATTPIWVFRASVILLLSANLYSAREAEKTADEARCAAVAAEREASYCVKQR